VVVKTGNVLAGALASILFVAGPALAQDAPAAPAALARPDVKQVGDWFVRCYPVQSPSPCDMFHEQDSQQTRQRILSISIAYAPAQDRHIAVITLPLEISIPKGVVIQTDSFTSPVMHYRVCNREGCFVQMVMDNAMVDALGKSGPAAKLNIGADNGKSYGLNFSLKGFAAAHDEMVAQARAKAKSAPKPAAGAAPAATP
jgi:invasion protein IalB